MTDQQAFDLVKEVFGKIQNAKSIQDLQDIFDENTSVKAKIPDPKKYPKLDFSISAAELQILQDYFRSDKAPNLQLGLSTDSLPDPDIID